MLCCGSWEMVFLTSQQHWTKLKILGVSYWRWREPQETPNPNGTIPLKVLRMENTRGGSPWALWAWPCPPSSSGKQHPQPGLSGASPAEQWGLSEPCLPVARTPSAPAHGGGGTHPSWLEEIPLAPNAVLNVDQLLQVFLWVGAGWGGDGQGPFKGSYLLCKEMALLPLQKRKMESRRTLSKILPPASGRVEAWAQVCRVPSVWTAYHQASPFGPGVWDHHLSACYGWFLALLCRLISCVSLGHCFYSNPVSP